MRRYNNNVMKKIVYAPIYPIAHAPEVTIWSTFENQCVPSVLLQQLS